MFFNFSVFIILLQVSHVLLHTSVRHKRSLLNFANVICCATGHKGLLNVVKLYNNYGCFCGFGGSGTPVDGIDNCCRLHDNCYGESRTKGSCRKKLSLYFTKYNWSCEALDSYLLGSPHLRYNAKLALAFYSGFLHNIPLCTWSRSSCAQALCRCDVDAALCFAMHWHPGEKPTCPVRS